MFWDGRGLPRRSFDEGGVVALLGALVANDLDAGERQDQDRQP